MADMSAKYEQDPADPVIEEIATSLAEKWTMAMFFFLETRDGIEQLVEWAMESSYLDGVMEAPKGILASFCANQWAHEFFYAVKSATEPFQEEQKWCVQLKVQEYYAGEPNIELAFILGFTKVGQEWLIDLFRLVYH